MVFSIPPRSVSISLCDNSFVLQETHWWPVILAEVAYLNMVELYPLSHVVNDQDWESSLQSSEVRLIFQLYATIDDSSMYMASWSVD